MNLKEIQGQEVKVFLTNGIKLLGKIEDIKDNGFLLIRDNDYQFVFLQAVATIMPIITEYIKDKEV
jgi:sRNA-binding regulator protein Hfq